MRSRVSESDQERLTALLRVYPDDLLEALRRPTAEALLDGARLSGSLEGSEEVERQFLAFMARLGGEVSPAAAGWWLWHRGVESADGFVEGLAQRGLVFYVAPGRLTAASEPVPDARGVRLAGKLWVPEAMGGRAAESCPVPSLTAVDGPPDIAGGDPWEIIRQLFILTRYLAERRPRILSTSGKVSRADLAELAETLGERRGRTRNGTKDAHLLWLECVATQARLAEESDRRLVPAPDAIAFFERRPEEQRGRLLEAALAQTGWGELETAEEIALEVPSAVAPGHSDVPSPGNRVRARRHVLRVLSDTMVPGEWHSLGELAEHVMEADPDFLIRRRQGTGDRGQGTGTAEAKATALRAYRGIRGLDDGQARVLCMFGDWRLVEGMFVARFVSGPLHWLGLVDLGGTKEEPLFRVTQVGARVLEGEAGRTHGSAPTTAEGEEETRAVVRFFVQPNFEIMADGGGENVAAVVRLFRVADLTSFDRAALLKVTRESVLRGLDAGLSGEQILAILGDEGRVAIPQNVEYSVSEWAAAYDRYELRTEVCVIEVDDEAELAALEAELPGCLEWLGPTSARVPAERVGQVEAALSQREGVLHIDHAEGLGQLFDLDERMVATPIREKWHWYPEHLLGQIGKRREAGVRRTADGRSQESGVRRTAKAGGKAPLPAFQLTMESVQKAMERGLQAEEIEGFVEACARGGLTATQRLLLRGWLGRYPPAGLAAVTVLALPAQVVPDALAIPEFREQIEGWLSSGVFVVRQKGRAKVKRLLERAGIALKGEAPAVPLAGGTAAYPPTPLPSAGGRDKAMWGRRQWRQGEGEAERVALVQEAIEEGLRIEVEYESVVKGEAPKRWVLTPHRLERSRWGQMRVHAYCHERETERVFDLGRVTAVVVIEAGWEG